MRSLQPRRCNFGTYGCPGWWPVGHGPWHTDRSARASRAEWASRRHANRRPAAPLCARAARGSRSRQQQGAQGEGNPCGSHHVFVRTRLAVADIRAVRGKIFWLMFIAGLNVRGQTFLPLRTIKLSEVRRQIVELLPRLRRMAWAIARDSADGDDLLQRTVERALERAHTWQPGSRLDLWMLRIMKNLWIDEIRSRTRWGRVLVGGVEDQELGDGGAGSEDMLDAIELTRLRALVDDLPEEQRLAIKLVLLGGCSCAEAASILEIPEGTLTSRLARGRAALLRHYQTGETRH